MLSPIPITQDQRSAGLLLHLRRFGLPPEPESKIRRCLICKEVIHTGAESIGNKKAKYCTYCRRRTDHLNYLKFLIFLLVIITPGLTRAQGNLGSNSSPVVNRQGIPLGGVDIAVCQPVATTSASVTNNLATLIMAVNPQVYGYVAGMTIMISGFTGADSFLNAGTLTNGQIVGGQTILAVTSTSIVFTIGHIDTGTSSNGTVLQEGNGSYGCAGLSTVYSDPALTTPTTNPFTSDQLGNWNVFAASGIYDVQFYSPSTSPTMKIIGVSPSSLTGLPGLALNNMWTGNETHTGTETFATINVGSNQFSTSADACCTGALKLNSEFENTSGIFTFGSMQLLTNDAYTLWMDNGFQMQIQAGPRIGGGFNPLLANSIYNLPDLANGGSSNTAGALLGETTADIATSSGHCLFSSGSSQGGLMNDSHIGCNSTITLPAAVNAFQWTDGTHTNSIVSATISGGNTVLTAPAATGTIALQGTLTLKTGSGGGNYTGANTTFAAVDTTNLCYSVTVPTGWKLSVQASGVLESVTAAVVQSVALADAGATCTTGGVTALAGSERDITPAAIATFDASFATAYVLTGDGSAHSIVLLAKTANGSDDWGIQNTSAAAAPSMTFTLTPSN